MNGGKPEAILLGENSLLESDVHLENFQKVFLATENISIRCSRQTSAFERNSWKETQ